MRKSLRKMTCLLTAVSCVLAAPGTAAAAESAAESAAEEAAGFDYSPAEVYDETEVILFAAKSLNTVMGDIIAAYQEYQPNVEIIGNYDSSGTLMVQIEEGAECDVFFSAAQKQMNELADLGLISADTRADIVNNQVCVVTWNGSGTEVTGLDDLEKASSFALADGSVPVGKYTREALMAAGILEETDDASAVTTEEVSEALGGLEINECANVGAVAAAVAEGANEVGTVYYSDTYGFEDTLEILEYVPYELTGNVIYPASRVVNPEADETEAAAAADFVKFLSSRQAKAIFEKYYFDTNV